MVCWDTSNAIAQVMLDFALGLPLCSVLLFLQLGQIQSLGLTCTGVSYEQRVKERPSCKKPLTYASAACSKSSPSCNHQAHMNFILAI